MIYLLLLLTVSVILQSCAILFLVRQIGFVLSRTPSRNNNINKAVLGDKLVILPGTDMGKIQSGGWKFVFASSSCPLCRPILESLSKLSPDAEKNLSVLVLDDEKNDEAYSKFREKYSLDRFTLLNGFSYVAEFGIKQTPLLLVVDRKAIVIKRELLRSVRQIEAV